MNWSGIITLPAEEEKPIGVYRQRHLCYLKEYHRLTYTNLLTCGKLNSYLADIDEQAKDMFIRLVKEMAEHDGITEKLKAENQMLWVGKMNAVREAAMEVVNTEIIFI